MSSSQARKRVGKRWVVRDADATHAKDLSVAFGVSETLARILVGRGVKDEGAARSLLNPSLAQLHDPFLLKDMRRAVERIMRAVKDGERILVYGDYDVDGTTGTVVLRRALQLLGAKSEFHVPHRFTEGYGVRQDVLERAKADGVRLVITVDCGIRAYEPLRWAQANELDVVVTDHHLPDAETLPAVAVINPNQPDCAYPDKFLAGVGVAFKLAHALLRVAGREDLIGGFLKMVALGTVADITPLVGENRTIVWLGLADLSKATNHGLRALLEVSGCRDGQAVSASAVGFRVAPRINAAGRMDAARKVVELFETNDAAHARELAETLDQHNRERQTVQEEIVKLALGELEASADKNQNVAIISGDGWHRGVLGLAASKIAERANRPAIVISFDGALGHGSARSIEAYHLLDGLESCADLFETFGGHSHAAGLTIKRERLAELRERLNTHVGDRLSAEDFMPSLTIDAEVEFSDVTQTLVNELGKLEPFGCGWARPVLLARDLVVTREPFVMKDKHLKFYVAAQDDKTVAREVVWWDGVEKSGQTPHAGQRIELAFAPEINEWRGEARLQLVAKDCRVTS